MKRSNGANNERMCTVVVVTGIYIGLKLTFFCARVGRWLWSQIN